MAGGTGLHKHKHHGGFVLFPLCGSVPDEGDAQPEAQWAVLLLAAGLAVSRVLSYASTGGYEDAKTGNAAL